MTRMLGFALLMAWLEVAALASPPPKTPKPAGRGTDILHLFLRKEMVNEGLFAPAKGQVKLGLNRQGNAFNQRLDVSAANLPTNTPLALWAATGENTNFNFVTSLTTDSKGRTGIRFMKVSSVQGFPGRGKTPLPNALHPVSDIRELALADLRTQAVLSAELRAPEKLQYLVKRTWSEGSATASLRLKATTQKLKFELRGEGLAPSQNYLLALNGTPVGSASSHADGVVVFTNLPVSPSNILHVRWLAIWNSASNSVLSTTLP
ncbi:MAG: hypothetical protein N3I86_10595 [Verrucomicrobiae bacterium]|nr:hypothetical protein [Verrucomicrobiae bacterium]